MPSHEIPQVDQDLEAAIANRDFERAMQLLHAGANINRPIYRIVNFDRDVVEESTTYLMNAASFGDVDTMRFLLANGADPNYTSVYDNGTALLQAAVNRESAAVGLLLAHRADVHLADRNNKRNALEYALSNVDPTIVRSLVAAGARGSLRDIGFSIDGGQAAREVVRVLVDHGIDINQIDDWGRTPLMWAAEYAELETVRFMIELGADVHRVTEENMNGVHTRDTALSLARKQKRHDIVALLEQHGARDAPGPGGGSLLSRVWDALTD